MSGQCSASPRNRSRSRRPFCAIPVSSWSAKPTTVQSPAIPGPTVCAAGTITRIVFTQGLLYAVTAYVPALLLACGLYELTRSAAGLPVYMTGARLALGFVSAVAMCSLSGLLATRKLQRADPAELF